MTIETQDGKKLSVYLGLNEVVMIRLEKQDGKILFCELSQRDVCTVAESLLTFERIIEERKILEE